MAINQQVLPNLKTASIEKVFDRKLLPRITEDLYWSDYGQSRSIPAHSNVRTAFARKYKNLLPAMTPLEEYNGTRRVGNKIVLEEIEYDANYYGDYAEYTNRVVIENLRSEVTSDFADILAEQAAVTVDSVHRDVLFSGTNIIFADGATSTAGVAGGLKRIKEGDLRMAGLKLTKQRAKHFKKRNGASEKYESYGLRARFIFAAADPVIEDIRELDGFIPAEKYAHRSNLQKNEQGSIQKFAVCEVPNVKIEDVGGVNVYSCLAFGRDSYATTTIKGHGSIKTHVHKIGSSGAYDPINEIGTVGWSTIAGAVILNQHHLIEIKTTASMEDLDDKHYYA